MKRRSFLASAGMLAWPTVRKASAQQPPRKRKANPYEALLPFTDPAKDEFECEKRAIATLEKLKNLTPEQRAWRDQYGAARSVRFYPLTNDDVRYEIASTDAKGALHYRTGLLNKPDTAQHATASKPLFTDVSAPLFGGQASFRDQLAKGVPYWRSRLDLATGINMFGNNGIAVGDIDNDGFDEIYVCQPSGLPNRLYKRRASDGTYEDVTARAGVDVLDETAAALFVDLRNNGLQDLVVLTPSMILLFLNQGDGRFQHVPDAFRFATQPSGTFAGISAADYDRDGRLDLYICSYLYFQGEDQYRYPVPYHDAQLGPPNFLFRNQLNDGGYFEDVTASTGINANNNRYSFAASWCDYDGSGWPSLYVANDFGRKNLYKNDGGKFRDVAAEAGVEDMGPGMSAAWFDYDGDGRPDLYVANMWSPAGQRVVNDPAFGPIKQGLAKEAYHGHTKGNSLFRNLGNGKFEYTGAKERVEMGRWAWSADGYDFDLDGTPEIYIAAGMISHARGKELMSFFWRQAVSKSPITQKAAPAYENGWNALNQLVREDWSWNGHEPNVFYVRRGGRYVDHSGVSGLDHALDSRAFAVTDLDGDGVPDLLLKSRLGLQLMAFRNDSAASDAKPLVLELEGSGKASNRDAIGARVTLKGRNTQWVTAGSGYVSQHTKRVHFGAGGDVEILWPSGVKQTFANLEAGFRYRLKEGESAPVRKTPLTPRKPMPAAPAIKPNNDLIFEPTWLYDPLPLPEKRKGGPGFVTITEPSDLYATFRRYIFDYRAPLRTPITFLIDAESRVHKIYPGIPTQATQQQDLKQLSRSADLALPFPGGKFYLKPGRSFLRFAGPFAASGYTQEALLYLGEELKRDPANFKTQLAVGQMHLESGNIPDARKHLEIAAQLNSESAELWNNLGGVEMAKPDYPAALKCFERAMKINPDLPFAIINAGQAQNRLGNTTEAEKLFRRALELVPDDADAANHLGLLLARKGDYAGGVRFLQQAITHQRDHIAAINNLAVLYARSGKVNDAIAALRYGIEQQPDHDPFYFNLARLYADLGEKIKARQVLEDLLQRKPNQQDARKALLQLQ